MIAFDSWYQRSVIIRIADAEGLPVQPDYLDIVPRLRTTLYPDNQYIQVKSSDTLPGMTARFLGTANAWKTLAEFSGIIDPFTEMKEAAIIVAPSLATYHFVILQPSV